MQYDLVLQSVEQPHTPNTDCVAHVHTSFKLTYVHVSHAHALYVHAHKGQTAEPGGDPKCSTPERATPPLDPLIGASAPELSVYGTSGSPKLFARLLVNKIA